MDVPYLLVPCTSLTSPGDLLRMTARLEPGSCSVEAPLLEHGLGRDGRAWVVDTPGGDLAGMLLVDRVGFDRWVARPLLVDPGAAAVVAAEIEHAPTWRVEGLARHVDPVVANLTRLRGLDRQPIVIEARPVRRADPDPRVGVASPADLDGLLELYRGCDADLFPTRARLERFLRTLLERGFMVVARDGHRVIGAFAGEARSRATLQWSRLVLAQEADAALATSLIDQARALTAACTLTYTAVGSSELPVTADGDHTWVTARLHPRTRVPGHGLVRRGETWIDRRRRG